MSKYRQLIGLLSIKIISVSVVIILNLAGCYPLIHEEDAFENNHNKQPITIVKLPPPVKESKSWETQFEAKEKELKRQIAEKERVKRHAEALEQHVYAAELQAQETESKHQTTENKSSENHEYPNSTTEDSLKILEPLIKSQQQASEGRIRLETLRMLEEQRQLEIIEWQRQEDRRKTEQVEQQKVLEEQSREQTERLKQEAEQRAREAEQRAQRLEYELRMQRQHLEQERYGSDHHDRVQDSKKHNTRNNRRNNKQNNR